MRLLIQINRNLLLIFATLSVIASALLGLWIGEKKIEPLALIGEKTTYCDVPFSQNPRKLTVYITDLWLSKTLLTLLCEDPVVRRQFGNVTIDDFLVEIEEASRQKLLGFRK